LRISYFSDTRFPLERANGIQTMHTCHALAGRGHTVMLVVRPDTEEPPRDPFVYYGLPPSGRLSIVQVPAHGTPLARRLRYLAHALTRTIGRRQADIVFTRDLGTASALIGLPRMLRPPVVYESHAFSPEFARALPTMLSGAKRASATKLDRLTRRERRVWSGADGYVTITTGLALELATHFGSRRRATVIPDGVSLRPDRQFVEPRVGSAPVVAYAGHLYPWKGVDVLLQALAAVPGARGLIIGGHPGEPDLARTQARARELGIEESLTFAGAVAPTEVDARLALAEILVLPNTGTKVSARYTSPLKLFEYLAAGKPIIASDLPALREVLRHEENCLLTPAGDPRALAEAIVRLATDPTLCERLARQAFADATQYSWDRRAARLERLFEVLVKPARQTGQ